MRGGRIGGRGARLNESRAEPGLASPDLPRRTVLTLLGWLGLGACVEAPSGGGGPDWNVPALPIPTDPPGGPDRIAANVKALMDVLLPAERDAAGAPVSPGALEAGAYELLELRSLLAAAQAQRLLPELPEAVAAELDVAGFDAALAAIVSADLDALAVAYDPAAGFAALPRALQQEAVADGLDDPVRRPLIVFVRSVCFLAYLGAIRSDVGLRAIGHPPFEDFAAGIAVSGYPRTTVGGAPGVIDDYTYDRAPDSTPGDDPADVLDERGDIV